MKGYREFIIGFLFIMWALSIVSYAGAVDQRDKYAEEIKNLKAYKEAYLKCNTERIQYCRQDTGVVSWKFKTKKK